MIYSKEVENMCSVCKGAYHGPAPIPEEGKWGSLVTPTVSVGVLLSRVHVS